MERDRTVFLYTLRARGVYQGFTVLAFNHQHMLDQLPRMCTPGATMDDYEVEHAGRFMNLGLFAAQKGLKSPFAIFRQEDLAA